MRFLAILLCSMIVTSADADALYDECIEYSETGTDSELQKCGIEYVARRNSELDRVWKEAFDLINTRNRGAGATKSALLSEQRRWTTYKNQTCEYFKSGYFGREAQIGAYYTCRVAIIDERIGMLKSIFIAPQAQ